MLLLLCGVRGLAGLGRCLLLWLCLWMLWLLLLCLGMLRLGVLGRLRVL